MSSAPISKEQRQKRIRAVLEKYRKAGRISVKAKKLVKRICVPGAKAYDIVEKVEALIRKEGAKPAFPVNFSINHEAAHYSPTILDNRKVPENSIIKIDLGAEIDGYLVDTAITMNFDPKLEELAKISEEALRNAIEAVKPNLKVGEIGKVIEKTITESGYQPVRNLSGHQIKRYNLHAGVSIPNAGPGYLDRNSAKFEIGRIYAIEPFASTGKGWVNNDKKTNIFRYLRDPSKKAPTEIKILAKDVKTKVGVLPFSPRHLYNPSSGKKGKEEVSLVIKKLIRHNVLMGYPVLIEENTSIRVSQHEDTVLITKEGCEVLTQVD